MVKPLKERRDRWQPAWVSGELVKSVSSYMKMAALEGGSSGSQITWFFYKAFAAVEEPGARACNLHVGEEVASDRTESRHLTKWHQRDVYKALRPGRARWD